MIRFELQVNTGASMHVVQEAALSVDELDILADGAELGVESGMGAMAVAQRVAYLVAELAGRHSSAVAHLDAPRDGERPEAEASDADRLAEAKSMAVVLAQATALLDLLVRHFNTMVIINKD